MMNKSIDFSYFLFHPKNKIKILTEPKLLNGIVYCYKSFPFHINAILLNFLFIKES